MKQTFLERAQEINSLALGSNFYPVFDNDKEKIPTTKNLPFLVSGNPYELTTEQKQEIKKLGPALKELFKAVSSLQGNFDPFFIRPDILLTTAGFKICEVETQSFGFPLSIFLQNSFSTWFKTFGQSQQQVLSKFINYWQTKTNSTSGTFVYSNHTKKFFGQLQYFCKILNDEGGNFSVKSANEITNEDLNKPFYRAFYVYEQETNQEIINFINKKPILLPEINKYFEGKYILVDYFENQEIKRKISLSNQEILDNYLLPTWMVTNEIPQSFPLPIKSWSELSLLSRNQRNYVVKRAGGHPDASWSRSVVFLNKLSKQQITELFQDILQKKEDWVIQPFYKNEKTKLSYAADNFSEEKTMNGNIRFTPYFEYENGELLNMKVTARENTLFIHGASDSINTTVI